jgi:predicted MFS family arabinose efflux permease
VGDRLVAALAEDRGLAQPARLALVSLLVSRENLPIAVAMNSMIFNSARFVGPAIAGLVLATLGAGVAFIVNALTYAAFLLALTRLHVPHTPPPPSTRSFLGEVGAGVTYVARHPGIGPLLLMFAISAILVRPVGELLPGVASQIFGQGADGFAMLSASLGLGAVIASFWLTQRGGHGLFGICMGSIAGICVTTLIFVLSPSFAIGLAAATLLGACLTVAGVSAQTLVQLAVAPAFRGRTMALYGLVFRAAPAIGALALGTLADRLGLRFVLSMGVLACARVVAAILTRRHSMARALVPYER